MNRLIKVLIFDTELLGFRVGACTRKKITSEIVKKVVSECKRRKFHCLYVGIDLNNFTGIDALVKSGFVISDVRTILEKDISNFQPKICNEKSYKIDSIIKSEDISIMLRLSEEISLVSRFAFDNNFPPGSAQKIYKQWMLNSIKKTAADEIFILRDKKSGYPLGLVTCKNEQHHGEIILVGVLRAHLGKGIGSVLINRACEYFRENGYETVRIKTQAKNIPALRLYQKNGFFISHVSLIFHFWNL